MKIVPRRVLTIIVALFLFVVLPVTIAVVMKSTDPRSRASSEVGVGITSPLNSTTLSGNKVTLAAYSNPDIHHKGNHGVAFYLDGISIGSADKEPFTFVWDSTTTKNGTHQLTARVIDPEISHITESEPITITVANNVGDTTAASISSVKAKTIQDNFAEIVWNTDDKATSEIFYRKSSSDTTQTASAPTLSNDHAVALQGLEPNTSYTYKIKSIDAAGNSTMSDAQTFITAADTNATTGQWAPVPNFNFVSVHAVLLYTGDLMIWGWSTDKNKTKLWSPTTGTFIADVPISNNIFCSGHATLQDGRILTAGGHVDNFIGTKNTNIYDPATKKWTPGPTMRDGRWYPSVSVLANGLAVIFTGDVTASKKADVPEVYDPKTNTLSAYTNIATSQLTGYSAVFPTQKDKLYAISSSTNDVQLFDATNKTWVNKGKSPSSGGAAVQYRPGKIMMAGGYGSNGKSDTLAAVTDLSATSPTWRTIKPMNFGRFFHNLVNLPDGKVLAVGGASTSNTSAPTGPLPIEMWDPDTEAWTILAPLSIPRMYHSTAILLPDGRILSSGSRSSTGDTTTAEIYSPPYLFKGNRPVISAAPATISDGETIAVKTPDASTITKVSLLTLASQTHTLDMNQRFVDLTFTKDASGLQVKIPADLTTIPPGYYMIFILNGNGVPSVAKIVHVGDQLAPSPTLTPLPTATPTPTLLPTMTPTPSKVPTPTPTKIPTATPTTVSNTTVAITAFLHGIGRSGDNANQSGTGNLNPKRTQRLFTLTMFSLSRQVIATASANLTYNQTSGNYQGSIALPNVAKGTYQFSLKSPGYLQKALSGAQDVAPITQTTLPLVTLSTGDTNVDNKLTLLDYNRILDCYSDLNTAKNCDTDKKLLTDLNDDNLVNQIDYNLFIRELSVQLGE